MEVAYPNPSDARGKLGDSSSPNTPVLNPQLPLYLLPAGINLVSPAADPYPPAPAAPPTPQYKLWEPSRPATYRSPPAPPAPEVY